MNRTLPLSQRIHNCEACQEIEFNYSWHAYLRGTGGDHIENEALWSKRSDVSWSHAFGRERGPKSLYYNNVVLMNARYALHYLQMYLELPEIGGKRNFQGLKDVSMHLLATDIMEISDDGNYARVTFITPGFTLSSLNPDTGLRRMAKYNWERYGTDLVYENGKWHFLRSNVRPDLFDYFDHTNFARDMYEEMLDWDTYLKKRHGGDFDPAPEGIPNLWVLCEENELLFEDWTPIQTVQDAVPIPRPFYTLDRENTVDPGAEDYVGKEAAEPAYIKRRPLFGTGDRVE